MKKAEKDALKQKIIIALVVLGLMGGLGYGLKKLMSGASSGKKPVSTIKLLPDTPPPPPPPPPPPKEQPKDQPKEQPKEQPKQQEAPPSQQIKTDEAGAEGGLAGLGSGAVTKDLNANDKPGVIGGTASKNRFTWFTAGIKTHIEEALAKDKKLAGGKYSVIIHLWVENDGSFKKFELAGSSGDPDTDERIKAALSTMQAMADSPPDDMPQPVKLRVTAR